MKKILLLSIASLLLVGCKTYHWYPMVGEIHTFDNGSVKFLAYSPKNITLLKEAYHRACPNTPLKNMEAHKLAFTAYANSDAALNDSINEQAKALRAKPDYCNKSE